MEAITVEEILSAPIDKYGWHVLGDGRRYMVGIETYLNSWMIREESRPSITVHPVRNWWREDSNWDNLG